MFFESNGEIKNALARSIAELARRNTHQKISWKVIRVMLNDPLFRCKDKGLAMIEIEMMHRCSLPPIYILKILDFIRTYPARLLQERIQKIAKLKRLYSLRKI